MWRIKRVDQPGAKACFIMMHGLGASADNFSDFPLFWAKNQQRSLQPLSFICPQAPLRSITRYQGEKMPAWFDVFEISEKAQQDEVGIPQSAAELHRLIEAEEERGILPQHIFLGGFSQGSALALYTGLRYPKTLGGIVGFGGYLPLRDRLAAEKSKAPIQTPIRLYHGSRDTVVSLSLATLSYSSLTANNIVFDLQTEAIEHTISATMLEDAFSWMHAILKGV